MSREKQPLYRRVNTTAHGVHHRFGGDFRDQRRGEDFVSMKKGQRRGLDYTPLYRFLLSKVGSKWNEVHSEAVSRLDVEEPIFHLVALNKDEATEVVRLGESTYFSGLYVDDNGVLRVVNPDMNETTMKPLCKCCTHTFNGRVFTQQFGD